MWTLCFAKWKILARAGVVRTTDYLSGSNSESSLDRFKILMPYGGQYIKWEVLFNSCYPEDPPDLIFLSDDQEFIPDIGNLKSLYSWDSRNDESLFVLVQELVQEYKKYHLQLLTGSRLEYDYNSLVQDEACLCNAEDIEVHVTRRNGYNTGPVQFMMKLKIDFDRIPEYLVRDNPGEDKALVVVKYQNLEGGSVSTQIYLSPRIEKIFNMLGGLRPIPFPHEGCVMDYVPTVTDQIQKTIQNIVQCFEKRKEYITTFIGLFGSNVLEYDSVAFTRLHLLMERLEFRFHVMIDLAQNFSADQPTFTFLSIYQMKNENTGSLATKSFRNYSYSPRWSCQEMAERAKVYLSDQSVHFQKEFNQEGIL